VGSAEKEDGQQSSNPSSPALTPFGGISRKKEPFFFGNLERGKTPDYRLYNMFFEDSIPRGCDTAVGIITIGAYFVIPTRHVHPSIHPSSSAMIKHDDNFLRVESAQH
jgi:hypothetical protein